MPAPPAGIAAKKLALGQVAVAYQPTDPKKIWPGRYSPEVNAQAIQARIHELLEQRKDATVADFLSPWKWGTSSSDAAQIQGLDQTLIVSIEDATIRFERESWLPFKIVMTVFFFPIDFPNYFLATDHFALTVRAKWQLLDTASGQVIASGTSTGRQASVEGDFSRGWYFVGYLRVPGCLDADSWRDIADAEIPGAQDAIAEAVVQDVEKALAARKD
jgi:hypothetical protein